MRFPIDAQRPPAFARQLSEAGYQAEHVGDCGLDSAADDLIWNYAGSVGAAIVTKDQDFARRRILSGDGPPIVWIRLPNTRRRELLQAFAGILPDLLEALGRGESLIEVVGAAKATRSPRG